MTTPLERAARALYKQIGSDFDPFNEGEDAKWPEFIDEARAVIEAIREPSEAMMPAQGVFAGFTHDADDLEDNRYVDADEARYTWHSMIDALLAEGA